MEIRQIREKVKGICDETGIAMLAVFGSVARGEDRPDSDIDLVVRFRAPIGLLELIRIEDRFEQALGRRVDLGIEGTLHPLIQDQAAREMKIVYEA